MRTFIMDDDSERVLEAWQAEHNKTCRYAKPDAKVGAIGGTLTISFTDTTIGRLVKVSCACGESTDISGNI